MLIQLSFPDDLAEEIEQLKERLKIQETMEELCYRLLVNWIELNKRGR